MRVSFAHLDGIVAGRGALSPTGAHSPSQRPAYRLSPLPQSECFSSPSRSRPGSGEPTAFQWTPRRNEVLRDVLANDCLELPKTRGAPRNGRGHVRAFS